MNNLYSSASTPMVGVIDLPVEARRRRRARRVPHRVTCRLTTLDAASGETTTLTGRTINLSSGGVAVQLGRCVPVGAMVEIVLSGADGGALRGSGRVLHVRRVLTGTFEIGLKVAWLPGTGDQR